MTPRFRWIAVVIAVLVADPVGGANLLFVSDTRTDLDIPTVLESDGHTVTVVTDEHASGNAALKGELTSFSAVYWSTSQVIHDDLELLSDLATWVGNGGRLFVTGADGTYASYNPTTAFLELLGATGGWDGGYDLSPIADVKNPLTVGVVDVRGLTPLSPGDSDSVCGPLAPGTVGLSAPTTGSGPCVGGEAYGWTFRTYARGEIAWIESVLSTDSEFNILNPPAPNTALAPSQSYNLQVEFCPDAFGPRSGFLTIDHNAVNELDPIVIDFRGNGT